MPFLRAFGHFLPSSVVTNQALAARTGADPATIQKNTGIIERRYAASTDTIVSLGLAAARECLFNADLPAADVGLIVVAAGSIERCFPGPAASIAAGLGLAATPAIDLPMASAGSLVALALAADLAPRYGNILVIASEIMSRCITDIDPATAVLFGDGAGACLVSRDSGFARIIDSTLCTDGNYAESLSLSLDGPLYMRGLEVILQATRKIPRAILDLLGKHGLAPDQVSTYLMHQANLNLIRKVALALKVPEQRFFVNIARYGNTSSASLLIAASEWHAANPNPTGPIVFATFGAGFTWGALLAQP